MNNLLKRNNNNLIRVDGHLIRLCNTNAPKFDDGTNTPGLYNEEGKFLKSWDDLIAEGLVVVK